MRFVLVGRDPLADLFVEAARRCGHEIVGYLPVAGDPPPTQSIESARRCGDLQTVAGIRCDWIVLSGSLDGRAERLAQVLRFDPIDLVVATPVSLAPDIYYEAAMLQQESKIRLFPLLPDLMHPALGRLCSDQGSFVSGQLRFFECTMPLLAGQPAKASFVNAWAWLRRLGGEIESVTANAVFDCTDAPDHVVVTAVCEGGCLATFRWTATTSSEICVRVESSAGHCICRLPNGMSGEAQCTHSTSEKDVVEPIESPDLGALWLERWESLSAQDAASDWITSTRSVEIADAIERSLAKRRTISLNYELASESVAFRSVMTPVGCGLLFGATIFAVLMVPLHRWIAFDRTIGWLILPVVVVFLLLQLFGFAARRSKIAASAADNEV